MRNLSIKKMFIQLKYGKEIQDECLRLDTELWEKYYNQDFCNRSDHKELQGYINSERLSHDIEMILWDTNGGAPFGDSRSYTYIIDKILSGSYYGEYILMYYVDINKIDDIVSIKRKYDYFLKYVTAKKMAKMIGYKLTRYDKKELAKLHKSDRHKGKIEELLCLCNCDLQTCKDFQDGKYEFYLNCV